MNTRAYVSWRDMHASFFISAPSTPTCVYHDSGTVMGTYLSLVCHGACVVYFHEWGDAEYWKHLKLTSFEATAVSGHTFVFIDNDSWEREVPV